MKVLELSGIKREAVGRRGVQDLRKTGHVPCSLYGVSESIHFAVEEKALLKAIYTPDTYLIKLTIDGEPEVYTAIITSAKFQPLHDNLLDVEFRRVKEDKAIEVNLPIKLVGNSVGVLAGGKLVQKQRKLKVRGLFTKLPDLLTIDISELKLGRSLIVSDLKFDDLIVSMPKDLPICSVEITRSLRQEAAQAAKGKK
jgi:large subunit ribosomal protein L25